MFDPNVRLDKGSLNVALKTLQLPYVVLDSKRAETRLMVVGGGFSVFVLFVHGSR